MCSRSVVSQVGLFILAYNPFFFLGGCNAFGCVFISRVSCECQEKERKEKVAITFLASKTSLCDQLVHVKV